MLMFRLIEFPGIPLSTLFDILLVFSIEFCEICKNNSPTAHLRTTASVCYNALAKIMPVCSIFYYLSRGKKSFKYLNSGHLITLFFY